METKETLKSTSSEVLNKIEVMLRQAHELLLDSNDTQCLIELKNIYASIYGGELDCDNDQLAILCLMDMLNKFYFLRTQEIFPKILNMFEFIETSRCEIIMKDFKAKNNEKDPEFRKLLVLWTEIYNTPLNFGVLPLAQEKRLNVIKLYIFEHKFYIKRIFTPEEIDQLHFIFGGLCSSEIKECLGRLLSRYILHEIEISETIGDVQRAASLTDDRLSRASIITIKDEALRKCVRLNIDSKK